MKYPLWITLFTAHGKAKAQLSRVLQTELPTTELIYPFENSNLGKDKSKIMIYNVTTVRKNKRRSA